MPVSLAPPRNHVRLAVASCDAWGCPWETAHPSPNVARNRLRTHRRREHPPLVNVPLPFD